MIKEYRSESAEATEKIGRMLASLLEEKKIGKAFIALRGEMGVGKTAFTRGFAAHFGIKNVKSPTFTVLNEHVGRAKLHHFDFYRISGGDDLYSIGYDDIIEDDGYCIGEWSENILDFLPNDVITVSICRISSSSDLDESELRYITIDFGNMQI